jgi:hypothetical protein
MFSESYCDSLSHLRRCFLKIVEDAGIILISADVFKPTFDCVSSPLKVARSSL